MTPTATISPTSCIGEGNAWTCEGTPIWESPEEQARQARLCATFAVPRPCSTATVRPVTPSPVISVVVQAPTPATPEPTIAPTEAPPPAPTVAAATQEPLMGTIETIICSFDWPCSEAISVAGCESGRDKNGYLDGNFATNGQFKGLFQMGDQWNYMFDGPWSDPYYNSEAAHELYVMSGRTWAHWSCKPWY